MRLQFIYFLLIVLFPVLTSAQLPEETRRARFNVEEGEAAIKGYDPVSYFTEEEPLKGSKKYSFIHKGVTYHFASDKNLETFKANPEKYEPAYGGWCAYAMGKGYTADINPETYKILDGNLLLFYNKLFNNTLPKWNEDEEVFHARADSNWVEYIADH